MAKMIRMPNGDLIRSDTITQILAFGETSGSMEKIGSRIAIETTSGARCFYVNNFETAVNERERILKEIEESN